MEIAKITLPAWVGRAAPAGRLYPDQESRMRLVIRLSELNVKHKTGGPFGAAVFMRQTGEMIAAGVNRVVRGRCSLGHAEAVALIFAQKKLKTFDLGGKNLPEFELVTSSQPCIQCFGAVWWSGVKGLIIGARGCDVEENTGFDEGPLPRNWVAKLENRRGLPPVIVVRDLLRKEALAALIRYKKSGGLIYNAGST